MKYDLVIWDFNGTIADDVQIGIDAANVILSKRGMKTIDSVESYKEMFCFPISEYYKRLGFDYSKEPYEVPANEWAAEYIRREPDIKLTEGCRETLDTISKLGIKQIVLSSSEINMLKRELKMLGVYAYFDEIIGQGDAYAHGKIESAKEWSAGKKYKALFIGDSVHDCECADAIGADCVLFSGGHDSRQHLEDSNRPVIDSIPEILSHLK
ncbi:MAG: HAD family hydrolase [Clostridia bacterium]|nr:HAD family hydrolase [Clostridia bacterium]